MQLHTKQYQSKNYLGIKCTLYVNTERSVFFSRALQELKEAGKSGYEELKTKCYRLEPTIAMQYPSFPFMEVDQLLDLPQDRYSKTLMPSDIIDMVPLRCIGDGNCLYR